MQLSLQEGYQLLKKLDTHKSTIFSRDKPSRAVGSDIRSAPTLIKVWFKRPITSLFYNLKLMRVLHKDIICVCGKQIAFFIFSLCAKRGCACATRGPLCRKGGGLDDLILSIVVLLAGEQNTAQNSTTIRSTETAAFLLASNQRMTTTILTCQ